MTYGEFLKVCRRRAKYATAKEFAEALGFDKPDHYRGAENDKRPPGRELLENAARLAGLNFQDCIVVSSEPAATREEKELLRLFRDCAREQQKLLVSSARVYAKIAPRKRESK